jgi:hypothetical protein
MMKTGTPRTHLLMIATATVLLGAAVVSVGCGSKADDTYSTTKGGQYIGNGQSAADKIEAKRAGGRLPNGGKNTPQ